MIEFDDIELIDEDPVVDEDLDKAYLEGYNDALDFAQKLALDALKVVRKGGEVRHAYLQNLYNKLVRQER